MSEAARQDTGKSGLVSVSKSFFGLTGEAWLLVLMIVGISALAGTYATLAAILFISPGLAPDRWDFYTQWILIAAVYAFTAGPAALAWAVLPVSRALEALGRGESPADRELEPARRRVLSLPLIYFIVIIGIWVGSILLMPATRLISNKPVPWLWMLLGGLGSLGIGLVHAVFAYYLVEAYSRKKWVPKLIPNGRVSRVQGILVMTTGWKMVLLFVTTGLVPVYIFTVFYLLGSAGPEAAVFLSVSSIIIGVFQIVMINQNIVRPVDSLHGQMARVRGGDLQAKVPVLSGGHLGQLAEGFNDMVAGLNRAESVKETFGRYVTPAVLDEILRGNVALGGERCVATVLFSDIRDFTSLSEKLDPEELVRLLNQHLDAMVEVLVAQGATVDKFVGDAIVAVFGVPVVQEDHAERAVRASLAMLERLRDMNTGRLDAKERQLRIGIGLHSGEVVAGNIGSAKKMEYTVIGDTVNTASRIEGLTKQFGAPLIVSADTYLLVEKLVRARRLQPVEVRGKSLPLQLYEVKELIGSRSSSGQS